MEKIRKKPSLAVKIFVAVSAIIFLLAMVASCQKKPYIPEKDRAAAIAAWYKEVKNMYKVDEATFLSVEKKIVAKDINGAYIDAKGKAGQFLNGAIGTFANFSDVPNVPDNQLMVDTIEDIRAAARARGVVIDLIIQAVDKKDDSKLLEAANKIQDSVLYGNKSTAGLAEIAKKYNLN